MTVSSVAYIGSYIVTLDVHGAKLRMTKNEAEIAVIALQRAIDALRYVAYDKRGFAPSHWEA